MPDPFRADAQAAASAVVIDPARWGEPGNRRSDLVEALQTAVVRRRKVRLDYADRARERTKRFVDPLGLVDKDGIWYLVAGTEDGQRTFRVDRVIEADVTDVPFERPADFRLAAAWERVVDEVERRRSLVSATVLINARFVHVLRVQFGRHLEVEGAVDDGRMRIRLAAPTALDIARHLAGWGALVEVVESTSVRAELARIGSELADAHGLIRHVAAEPLTASRPPGSRRPTDRRGARWPGRG